MPKFTHCNGGINYLRRSEITTWANESSKPITVNVTMKSSFSETISPNKFTLMFASGIE